MISNTDSVGSGHPGDPTSAENSTRPVPPSASTAGMENAPNVDLLEGGDSRPLSVAEHRLGGAVPVEMD